MKLLIVACLCVAIQANFLHDLGNLVDTVGDGVKGAVNTVGDGVKGAVNTVGDGVLDAAHTVGDGVDAAAHAVGGALGDVGHTLGGSFGDVWKVVKDPLKDAGEQILIQAGTFALEQGITLALNALAAGKRETTDVQSIKAYLQNELVDEYGQWMHDMEHNILGSKTEMEQALSHATAVNQMPEQLKKYVIEYTDAVTKGDTGSFIIKQAGTTLKTATEQLKERLQERLFKAINTLSAH